jgi:hypothetical protein
MPACADCNLPVLLLLAGELSVLLVLAAGLSILLAGVMMLGQQLMDPVVLLMSGSEDWKP